MARHRPSLSDSPDTEDFRHNSKQKYLVNERKHLTENSDIGTPPQEQYSPDTKFKPPPQDIHMVRATLLLENFRKISVSGALLNDQLCRATTQSLMFS